MPLPILGAVAAVGKGLVVGTAKAAVVGAKAGAKATVSTGKFFGKKTFNIANSLSNNAKNLNKFLEKQNKNQDKLRSKKKEEKQKSQSIEKKREKEKQLESKRDSSNQKKTEKNLAKSPLNILNKLFGFGGLLLGGILVNAAQGLIDKAKQFMKDNEELFNTIGNFLSGVKDAAVGLFNAFTGPESEQSWYDNIATFGDDGKLTGGALLEVDKAYDKLEEMLKSVIPALKGAKPPSMPTKEELVNQTERRSGMASFREDNDANEALQESVRRQSSASPSAQTPNQTGTSTPINDTSSSNRKDDHSVNTPQGGGNYPGFNPGTNPKKIYFHWSGGIGYNGRPAPYHSFVDGSGKVHYNSGYDKDRNNHTWRRNTNSVAIAANAMGHTGQDKGYIEAKGWAQTPLKSIQVNSMTLEAAKLALAWGWKESDINIKNIMTHAEAAANRDGLAPTPNYGPGGQAPIRWDLWYLKQGGAKWSGGEIMRNMIKQHMRNLNRQANAGSSTQSVSAITPAEPRGNQIASAINQPDPGEDDGQTLLLQRVNTIQYVPVTV